MIKVRTSLSAFHVNLLIFEVVPALAFLPMATGMATGEILSMPQGSPQCHFICGAFPLSWPLLHKNISYARSSQCVVVSKHDFQKLIMTLL